MNDKKEALISFIDGNYEVKNSHIKKIYNNYLHCLIKIIKKFVKGDRSYVKTCKKFTEDGSFINKVTPEFKKDFDNLTKSIKNIHTDLVPYSKISNIIYAVYNNKKNIKDVDGISLLCDYLSEMLKQYLIDDKNNRYNSYAYIVLLKTIEHIRLASKQIEFLRNKQEVEIQNSSNELSSNEQQLNNISQKLSKYDDEMSQIDKFKNHVYEHFVAILGIFATISVAMFSGISAISNSIDALAKNNIDIFNVVLLSSLFSFILLFMIFFMFICISKISGKSIKSSNSNDIFLKYPVFSYGISLLGLIFIFTLIIKCGFI